MKLIVSICLTFFLFSFIYCDNDTNETTTDVSLTPKIKIIRRIRNFFTDFLTEDQLSSFIDIFLEKYHEGATMAEIEEFAMTNAMDMIEDDQLMMGLSAYTKINKAIGSDKTMSILTTLLNVVSNNLMPFANQVMAKMEIMKAAGKGINAINNNAFMMVNQFMTKKRCRTIFTRIVKKIDKDDFDKAYPYIKSFLKFDLIEDLL